MEALELLGVSVGIKTDCAVELVFKLLNCFLGRHIEQTGNCYVTNVCYVVWVWFGCGHVLWQMDVLDSEVMGAHAICGFYMQ